MGDFCGYMLRADWHEVWKDDVANQALARQIFGTPHADRYRICEVYGFVPAWFNMTFRGGNLVEVWDYADKAT